MAARSPARSSAGPDVTCRPTPISVATMPARVVLPRPGGPANSRWSAAWPRRRAASRMIAEVLLELGLADELVERAGAGGRPRRPAPRRSTGSGPGAVVGAPRARSSRPQLAGHRRSAAPPARQGSPAGSPSPSGRSRSGLGDLVGRRSRGRPGLAHVGPDRPAGVAPGPSRPAAARDAAVDVGQRRAGDFSSTSRRAAVFLPTPGTRHSAATSSSASTRRRATGRVHRQDRQGQGRADAVGAEQRLEAVPARRGWGSRRASGRPRGRGGGRRRNTSSPRSPSGHDGGRARP